MGPISRQADSIMTLFRSAATAVHVVTVLEEMPVQETVDGVAELGEARLPVGAVVVNQVRQSPLPAEALSDAMAGTVDHRALRAGIVAGDLADLPHMSDRLVDEWAAGLAREVIDHAERVTLEHEQRQRLHELGRPVLELPRLNDGIDLGSLYTLAGRLAEQGVHGWDAGRPR